MSIHDEEDLRGPAPRSVPGAPARSGPRVIGPPSARRSSWADCSAAPSSMMHPGAQGRGTTSGGARPNVAFVRFSRSDGTSIQVRTTCAGAGGRFYAFALSPGGKEKPVRWTPTALEEPSLVRVAAVNRNAPADFRGGSPGRHQAPVAAKCPVCLAWRVTATEFCNRVRRGDVVYGGWVSIPHPLSARALAAAGLDYLVIDLQHGGAVEFDLPVLTAAIRLAGAAPI